VNTHTHTHTHTENQMQPWNRTKKQTTWLGKTTLKIRQNNYKEKGIHLENCYSSNTDSVQFGGQAYSSRGKNCAMRNNTPLYVRRHQNDLQCTVHVEWEHLQLHLMLIYEERAAESPSRSVARYIITSRPRANPTDQYHSSTTQRRPRSAQSSRIRF